MGRTTFALLTVLLLAAPGSASEYTDEVDAWHAGRIERLRQPDGWLSLVGLISLPEGRSSFGTAEGMDLRLDAPGPAHIGDVVVDGTTVRFTAAADVTHDDAAVEEMELAADVTGDPTILSTGSLSFYLILRHDRPYFRVRDAEAPLLAEFDGIERWPVDEAWRIRARWVEYDEPQIRHFPDVLGVAEPAEVEGEARFTVGGTEYALFPNSASDTGMFFVFGDATNGLETYGGGRFLYTAPPAEDGTIVLDFNRSYNPPCVFTPYATCPLPADGNFLDLEITAGEKMFGEAH
jgi:uncharacterized protein (DUF1684 family)